MRKLSLLLSIFVFSLLIISSCSKDDNNQPTSSNVNLPAGPQDTVTSFMVTFFNTSDSTNEIASYDDPDGPGPLKGNVGGVMLKKNSNYLVSLRIEDATGGSVVYLHNKIKTNGKDYKVCIGNQLGISSNPIDSDGSFPIGLESTLSTSSTTGYSNLTFTIKYQKGVKNGDCSPGATYYTCGIPVMIN